MPHRQPSVAGTVFVVLLVTLMALPGVVIVAHDILPRRLPGVERHDGGD